MTAQIKPVRAFGLNAENTKTIIELTEMSDGSINIALRTPRDGQDDLVTGIRISSGTFELLSYALNRAAHDPSVWMPWEVESKEV